MKKAADNYIPYITTLQGDDDTVYTGNLQSPFRGKVIQQQWVTLTASMWPEPTASPRGWRVSSERLPIIAAVFCGAAVVVCLLCAFVLYKCCVMPRKEKHFCMKKLDPNSSSAQSHIQTPVPSQAAIYAEQKGSGWGYSNRLVTPTFDGPWYIPRIGGSQCTQCPGICPVSRSTSNPGGSTLQNQEPPQTSRKQRPMSQPIQLGASSLISNGEIVPKHLPLPEICEFATQGTQYASSSILDEVISKDGDISTGPTLKTRSLPAWVRSKPRPLSTEDDLNDLYAKVNFSKKRKNRMRNDEAAIIALSRSRSQFLHKDTDSLVDNEAVIVYDERTAL